MNALEKLLQEKSFSASNGLYDSIVIEKEDVHKALLDYSNKIKTKAEFCEKREYELHKEKNKVMASFMCARGSAFWEIYNEIAKAVGK